MFWQAKNRKLLEMASFSLCILFLQLAKTQYLASDLYQTVGDALTSKAAWRSNSFHYFRMGAAEQYLEPCNRTLWSEQSPLVDKCCLFWVYLR
jgi:hypothetical protein